MWIFCFPICKRRVKPGGYTGIFVRPRKLTRCLVRGGILPWRVQLIWCDKPRSRGRRRPRWGSTCWGWWRWTRRGGRLRKPHRAAGHKDALNETQRLNVRPQPIKKTGKTKEEYFSFLVILAPSSGGSQYERTRSCGDFEFGCYQLLCAANIFCYTCMSVQVSGASCGLSSCVDSSSVSAVSPLNAVLSGELGHREASQGSPSSLESTTATQTRATHQAATSERQQWISGQESVWIVVGKNSWSRRVHTKQRKNNTFSTRHY